MLHGTRCVHLLAALTAALAVATTCNAAVIYVDDSATGANDGSSWVNAFTKIRPALAVAAASDEVRVAQGEYSAANPGGPRSASIDLPEGVFIDGGYAGVGEVDPDERDPTVFITTFTGDLDGDDAPGFANVSDNSLHVITADDVTSATVVRGVTITGGNANGVSGPPSTGGIGGGVLLLNGAEPVFIDCIVELNQARFGGGGLFGGGCAPLLRRCVFQGNHATHSDSTGGGAVLGMNSRVQSCIFDSNEAGNAGGALSGSNVDIDGSDFFDNFADHAGGGISGNRFVIRDSMFDGNTARIGGALRISNSQLFDCEFEGNASERGGAIINSANSSTLLLERCRFSFNDGLEGAVYNNGVMRASHVRFDRNSTGVSGFAGGALVNRGEATLANCRFFDNDATFAGGAISNSGDLTAVNCLFTGNSAGTVGGAILNDGGVLRVKNCTIVGNTAILVGGLPGSAIRSRSGATTRIHNSILWANSAEGDESERAQVSRESGTLTLANCIIQGWSGTLSGVNCTGDDPQFIDADGADDVFGTFDDDARLQVGSPAINAGDNNQLPPDTLDLDDDANKTERTPLDLDSLKRIRQGTVDIGAYEFIP